MRSMTGFGRGTAERGGARATVDVRAVNHRHFDLKIRGSSLAPAVEEAIATRLRAAMERGSVGVSIHVERASAGGVGPRIDSPGSARARSTAEWQGGGTIDVAAARVAHAALAALASELGMAPPDLALVLAQPGVVTTAADLEDPSEAVLAAAEAAVAQLVTMREAEGAALAADLTARLHDLAAGAAAISRHAAALPGQLQRRLHDRIAKLLAEAATVTALDPARLAQEVASLADRADVSEELVRLASHLDQAHALIASPQSVGRRLDFLVQEIGRELNTIGSKSALAEITSLVVEAKATLEKIREQVQNIE